MKIALIQCPAWGRQNPPLALAILAGQLKNRDTDTYLFDLNNELFHKSNDQDKRLWQLSNEEFWQNRDAVSKLISRYDSVFQDFLDKIIQTDIDIAGFSVFNSSQETSLLIADRLRNKNNNLKIVFGGPQCALHMQGPEIIKSDSVDIIVTGEGEETLKELIDLCDKGEGLKTCRGICFKDSGRIIKCENRPTIKSLDELACANFEDFDLSSYDEPHRLPIYISRGCINKCVYCNENLFWGGYRQRSGKRVFDEMCFQLNRHNQVNHFDFVDSLVNANLKELINMADLIIENNLKITWAGQAIINHHMSCDIFKKLRQSGCVCLVYGIESGSQKVLGLMKKGYLMADAERVIKDTHNAGIDVVTNFMFGFPGEDESDFKQTLDFISRNKEYVSSVNPSPAYTAIGFDTYLYNHPEEFDVDLTAGHLFWKLRNGENTFEVRRQRYQSFCRYVLSLGIRLNYPVDIGQA